MTVVVLLKATFHLNARFSICWILAFIWTPLSAFWTLAFICSPVPVLFGLAWHKPRQPPLRRDPGSVLSLQVSMMRQVLQTATKTAELVGNTDHARQQSQSTGNRQPPEGSSNKRHAMPMVTGARPGRQHWWQQLLLGHGRQDIGAGLHHPGHQVLDVLIQVIVLLLQSCRERKEKVNNSDNFVLSAKAGETEWKNNTIQTTLHFLQKPEWEWNEIFVFFSQLHTLLDTSKASAMIQTFPLPFHLRTVDHTPGKVAGTTLIISSHQNQSESQEHQCVCGCVVGVCMRTCVIHPGICLTVWVSVGVCACVKSRSQGNSLKIT